MTRGPPIARLRRRGRWGLALRAAQDGANICILAKTAEPHKHLPGTIYTAAEEIEKCGGRALALVVEYCGGGYFGHFRLLSNRSILLSIHFQAYMNLLVGHILRRFLDRL